MGTGNDIPLSRLALRHTAVPQFSGEKPEFTAWTRDARYYAKGVDFLSVFVSDPPQYFPVGELDTENSVLVGRGYNCESVHIHATGVEFPVDGPEEQERQEYLAQVHLAEKSVGRSLRGIALKRRGPNPTSLAASIVLR